MLPKIKYKTNLELVRIFKDGKRYSKYENPIPSYDPKTKTIYLLPNRKAIQQINSLKHETTHYFIDIITLNSICEKCTDKIQMLFDDISCWLWSLKHIKKWRINHNRKNN